MGGSKFQTSARLLLRRWDQKEAAGEDRCRNLAYNAAVFLPRCLGSVFAQTLKPDEIIVVDDGSTDNTAALATELGATVISRSNGGLSAARNTGIRRFQRVDCAAGRGRYVGAQETGARQAACTSAERC